MATAAQYVAIPITTKELDIDLSSPVERIRIGKIMQFLDQPIDLILEADAQELAGIGTTLSSTFLRCAGAIRKYHPYCDETAYACASSLEQVGGLLRKVTKPLPLEVSATIVDAAVRLRETLRLGSI